MIKIMNKISSFLTKHLSGLRQSFVTAVNKGVTHTFFSMRNLLIASALSLSVLFTAPIVTTLNRDPYTHASSSLIQEKEPIKGQNISVLSWNVCFLPLATTNWEQGIKPWTERLDQVAEKILQEDADLVTLQEVYDSQAAQKLTERLKEKYSHIYYNIGPKTLGVNSGLFVASKFPLKNTRFTQHENKKIDIDSFFVNKGFFDFEIYAGENKIAHVFVTHLQHSTDDLHPLKIDQEIREQQLKAIFTEMEKEDVPVLLVGDFNMPLKEYKALKAQAKFQNFLIKKSKKTPKTFKGILNGKQVDLTLDYALLGSKDSSVFLFTQVLPSTQSDHLPLKTTLSFPL